MNPGLICPLDQIYSTTRLATIMSMVMNQIANNVTTLITCQVCPMPCVHFPVFTLFPLLPQVMATFSFVSKSSHALQSQAQDTFALLSHISLAAVFPNIVLPSPRY